MVVAAHTFRVCDCTYPSTKQSKYSNCTVKTQNILGQSGDMLHPIYYFDQDQMPLLTYVIQCKLWDILKTRSDLLDPDKT